MRNKKIDLLAEVAEYYTAKLLEHGETALGVDWNGEEGQKIRFDQLCKVIDFEAHDFSLNDLGCGYGALFDYLHEKCEMFSYLGVDIADDMIRAAELRKPIASKVRFITASEPDIISDYGIASGIFNVRMSRTDSEWYQYLQDTLDIMNRTSQLGFSFNCLTSYSDEDKKRDYLYYADPCQIFDLCKRRYSRQIAILHDYGMYEFTVVVRKK